MPDIVKIRSLPSASDLSDGDYAAIDNSTDGLRKVALGGIISDLKSALDTTDNTIVNIINDTSAIVQLSALPVYADGKYMNVDGTLTNASAHRVVTIDIRIIKKISITLNTSTSSIAFAILKNQSNVVVKAWGPSQVVNSVCEIDLSDYMGLGYTLYINWLTANTTPTTYYNSLNAYYVSVEDIANEVVKEVGADELYYQINNLPIKINTNDLTQVSTGYMKADGTIGSGTMHRYLSMDAKGLSYIKYDVLTSVNLPFIVIKDANNNVIFTQSISGTGVHEYYFDACGEGCTAYINQYSFGTVPNEYVKEDFYIVNYISIPTSNRDEIMDLFSITRTNRPYSFSGKSATFCGDSITRGYTSGTTTTENGFPKLFSDAVGMTFTNSAVGGVTLSVGIKAQVEAMDTSKDFLFIAGGINDWQTGVALDTFESAVEDICDWLNSNYTGEVIWITPINQGGYETTHSINPIADIQDYRDIITKVVTIKNNGNMAILQGNLFGFPSVRGNSELKTSLFGDLLHPTEHGYVIYAQALRTFLC